MQISVRSFERLIALFLISIPAFATEYTFQTLDVPGASDTYLAGINNFGRVIGSDTNASGSSGFLYSAGSFQTLTAQGTSLIPSGINNLGQVVGNNSAGSFVYSGGSYTQILAPPSPYAGFPNNLTSVIGINDSGQLLENITSLIFTNGTSGGHAYVIVTGNSYTVALSSAQANAAGLDNSGTIVGSNLLGAPNFYDQGFYSNVGAGLYQAIVAPSSIPSVNGYAEAINNSNQVVGFYGNDGFSYQGGVFTTVNYPGAYSTQLFGINDEGDLVGNFTDNAGGASQGFIASPSGISSIPEPSACGLLLCGSCLLAAIVKRRGSLSSPLR